jgi:hypothetical protein
VTLVSFEGGDSPAKRYAGIAALVLIALYLPYFFLPVTQYDGRIVLGWEGFLTSFLLLWPIALGHLLLWVGWACLATRYFRSAAVLGVAALIISLACLALFPLDGPNTGIYLKLACMAVLAVAGVVGSWRFRGAASRSQATGQQRARAQGTRPD